MVVCRLNIIKNEDSEEKKQVKGTTLEKKKKRSSGRKICRKSFTLCCTMTHRNISQCIIILVSCTGLSNFWV